MTPLGVSLTDQSIGVGHIKVAIFVKRQRLRVSLVRRLWNYLAGCTIGAILIT